MWHKVVKPSVILIWKGYNQACTTQSSLVEYFPSPRRSAATPATQTSRTSEFLIREYFLEGEKEARTFNSRLLWPNDSTFSSEHDWSIHHFFPGGKKKDNPAACFFILNTHSPPSKNNRISAVLTVSLYILRQNTHPHHSSVREMGKLWLSSR